MKPLILSHRIALDPTNVQQTYFRKACGTARFAYNWALAEWQRQYLAGEKPTVYSVDAALNAVKRQQFPWMQQVTKFASQESVHQLGDAFRKFFAKRNRYPQFHKKGKRDSFFATAHNTDAYPVKVSGRRIFIPKLGWVRMRETLRFSGKILSATVSRTADRWFVSLAVEFDHIPPVRENQSIGGVDLGITSLATISDGTKVAGPKALRNNLERLRRASRQLSRKVKGSANRQKAKQRVAHLHARVANVRKDALHKLTTGLVRKFTIIGIEDLAVRNMVRNRSLARSISDMGWGEFRRQLEYKAPLHGSQIVVAPRFYPSSKTCSVCRHVVDKLPLSVREWTCPACQTVHDRDGNASQNLRQFAVAATAGLAGSNACGDVGSGRRKRTVKPTSVKQELGSSANCGGTR